MSGVRPLNSAAVPALVPVRARTTALVCALGVVAAQASAASQSQPSPQAQSRPQSQPPSSSSPQATYAGRVAPCDPTGRDLCDLDRPEDLTALRGTPWVLVSTLGGSAPLVLVDARDGTRVRPEPGNTMRSRAADAVMRAGTPASSDRATSVVGDPACTAPPTGYRGAGHDVRRATDVDGWRVALVNHGHARAHGGERDRIELFDLHFGAAGVPRLEWRGCVEVPDARWMLNDVALGPRGELYATLMYERESGPDAPARLRQRWIDGEATGRALRWQPGLGWHALEGTALVAANGIVLATDDRTLAIAGTYSRAVLLVDVAESDAKRSPRRIDLPLQPDNLTALPGGGFLVAGHTGVPVSGVNPCRTPAAMPCGFPFAVARIAGARSAAAPQSSAPAAGVVDVVYRHDGRRIPGASVALALGRELWLGSAFGDRITILDEVLK